MNHQLQQLVAQTVTHFTSVNMLPINASNIPQNPGIPYTVLFVRLMTCSDFITRLDNPTWISIFF